MARRFKQYAFTGRDFAKPADSFGGSLLKGNPKGKRPLDSKMPILLTLRAEKSVLRLPRTFGIVAATVDQVARKHGITIYSQANVGNHMHMLMKLPGARRWAAFIRELTGRIAQLVGTLLNGTGDGSALRAGAGAGGFWKFRPHTRIVRGWRKAFRIAQQYIYLNQLEAEGHINRRETKTLAQYREIWSDTA